MIKEPKAIKAMALGHSMWLMAKDHGHEPWLEAIGQRPY